MEEVVLFNCVKRKEFNKFYLKVYEKNKGKIIEKRNNNKLLFEKKKASMDSICC